ncbi:unnamed protein product [Cutaneotrichosporon oleaginosum]
MDAIVIPADNVPADLRPIEQTLKRAAELKKVDPVVSYWCCFWAAQKALKIPNRSREGTSFLMRVLDALEEMKAALGDNEAVTNEAVGSAHVESFALKVFLGADNADRAGDFSKATIRKFVVAGQFIDVLNAFETGMSEEMSQKAKYAKWKAADLAKCLREGRTPVPGPPVDPMEAELAALAGDVGDAGDAERRESASPAPGPSAGSAPASRPTSIAASPARSPLASPSHDLPILPGVPLDRATSATSATSLNPGLGSPPAALSRTLSGGSARSGGSGSGGMGLPSFPPPALLGAGFSTFDTASDDAEDQPQAMPRSSASRVFIDLLAPSPDPPASPPAPSPVARAASSAPPLSPPRAVSPPRAPTSPARAPPRVVPAPAPAPVRAAPVIPPPAPASAPPLGAVRELTRAETERCQKHCRWAISALEFEDPETARTELLKALAMLS